MTTARTPHVRPTRLDPGQRAMLRGMLEEQRRFRIEQIANAQAPDNGRVARQLTAVDREINSQILQAAQVALRDIDTALARLADGTYGKCTSCGARQPIERLEVLPQSALCMDCQRSGALPGH